MNINPYDVLLQTYPIPSVNFVRGDGAFLYDSSGKQYIDCLAGIAVVSVGHANSRVTDAVTEQVGNLIHVSNLFATDPALHLAKRLQEITRTDCRSFFTNSGAESNECAIKLVRKWGTPERNGIICADGGFHGRTLGSLAATGQPGRWQGFEPLPKGFTHASFNNLESFENAVDEHTVAIMIEPIQGECGVIPAEPEFLQGLRRLCDKHNLALIFDEVQTGIGRTGHWWAFQEYDVVPDILTSAKGLGNGFPIGACIALSQKFFEVFQPGDHGTTYGGGPVPCSAAIATIATIEQEKLLEAVTEKGEFLKELLTALPQVSSVRGLGLMIGAELTAPVAKEVVRECLKRGLILNNTSDSVLRLVPPLVISLAQLKDASTILGGVLKELT